METPLDRPAVTRALVRAGCVAAEDEADELVAAAADSDALAQMVARRVTGEPLAWITGRTVFCGLEVGVDPGVYVPRWQSEPLARLAAQLLPSAGVGVDLGTGSGAVAMVMQTRRPAARVVATEIDPVAVDCARRNGVTVYPGDLVAALPAELASGVDVMVGVLPYVPDDAFHLLPRDVQEFEPRLALDGGVGGLGPLGSVVSASPLWIRPGGWLALEVGGDQVGPATALFESAGFGAMGVLEDADRDPRAVYGQLIRR